MKRYGMEDLARVLLDNGCFRDEAGVWQGPCSREETARSAPRPERAAGADVVERARRYGARLPASVSGAGGHGALWEFTLATYRGFALERAQARQLAQEFSDRCQPAWGDREIEHKLDDVEKAKVPWGYIVGRQPDPANPTRLKVPAQAATGPQATEPAGYRFAALTSEVFFRANYQLEWLVQRLLVRGQPGVLGGPKKVLKTTLGIDLAVSLATGSPFLGHFKVYKPHRVLLISGESGEAVLQETGRRVCKARGIDPYSLAVHWSFRLPQAGNVLDRAELHKGIKDLGVGVVLLDPLYLSLLAGTDPREVEAGNLYQIGPLLSDLSRACLDAGATPLLFHHARKNVALDGDPMDLEDLSFSGIQEFARQWLLVNRVEPYDPAAPGRHRLWLAAGGSAGHGGLWELDVAEGELGDDFAGRKWDVAVKTAGEARQESRDAKEDQKAQAKAEQLKRDGSKVLAMLDRCAREKDAPEDGAAGYTRVRDLAGLSNAAMTRAVQDLCETQVIEECQTVVQVGPNHSAKRTAKALRRLPKRVSGFTGTEGQNPGIPILGV
jgi:hypothetical protein